MKLRITISKYHSWYLCQVSLQLMLLPIQISLFTTVKFQGRTVIGYLIANTFDVLSLLSSCGTQTVDNAFLAIFCKFKTP